MEGGTAPLGVPFALIATLFILTGARNNLRCEPLNIFFLAAYLLAGVLFFSLGNILELKLWAI